MATKLLSKEKINRIRLHAPLSKLFTNVKKISLWYRVPQGLGYLQTNYHMFIQTSHNRTFVEPRQPVRHLFPYIFHHLSRDHNNSSYNVFLDQKHLMIFYVRAGFTKPRIVRLVIYLPVLKFPTSSFFMLFPKICVSNVIKCLIHLHSD